MTYIYTLFNNIASDVSGRQKLGLVFEKKYFLPPKNFNKWNLFGFETSYLSSGRVFGYPIHLYYAVAFLQWSIKHHYRLLEDMRAGAGNQTFLSIICSIFRQTQTE